MSAVRTPVWTVLLWNPQRPFNGLRPQGSIEMTLVEWASRSEEYRFRRNAANLFSGRGNR